MPGSPSSALNSLRMWQRTKGRGKKHGLEKDGDLNDRMVLTDILTLKAELARVHAESANAFDSQDIDAYERAEALRTKHSTYPQQRD